MRLSIVAYSSYLLLATSAVLASEPAKASLWLVRSAQFGFDATMIRHQSHDSCIQDLKNRTMADLRVKHAWCSSDNSH